MLVYAHQEHWYEDRARRVTYTLQKGTVKELPQDVGRFLADARPDILCVVESFDPNTPHVCGITQQYEHVMVEEAPRDTAMPAPVSDRMAKSRTGRRSSA